MAAPVTDFDIERYRANLQDEIDGAAIYRAMAEGESVPQLAELYLRLADAESRHASLWEERLRAAGVAGGRRSPTWRARMLAFLGRRIGAAFVAPTIAAHEAASRGMYDAQPEARAGGLPAEERSHARLFRELVAGRGAPGPVIARLEGRHRGAAGNALRAAVLGVNDGLVSNLSLVMGVAGFGASNQAVLVAGVAGLLAGSLAMAMGEWLSVQSARELYARQIAIEETELREAPEEEEEELALIYQAKGVPEGQSREIAAKIARGDLRVALDTLAREELGIDPQELGGSAWVAAATSFAMFASGAIVALLPFLFIGGTAALVLSGALGAVALFLVGAAITLVTGQDAWRAGTRQLLIGLAAAAITFGIGRLLGVAIG